MASVADRIRAASTVNPETGCWEWQLFIDRDGYGKIKIGGSSGYPHMAHRASHAEFIGPIPDGHQVDHLCRNRSCVNPDHLEAVTPRENTLRSQGIPALNARKVVCKWGHPLAGENLRVSKLGQRQCRACASRASKEHAKRKASLKG